MSMHKIPLTQTEEEGLRAHGLDIGTPSQLSDVFRQGVAWGQKAERKRWEPLAWGIAGSFGRARAKWVAKLNEMLRSNANMRGEPPCGESLSMDELGGKTFKEKI